MSSHSTCCSLDRELRTTNRYFNNAASKLPAAIAGPYAKRLAGTPAAISRLTSAGAAIIRPVPASVVPSLLRWIATATASTPPATAVKSTALTTASGPEQAADRCHQLHVARPCRAERVAGQHEHQADDTPEHRRADRDAAESERREPEARARHAAGQDVGNPPRPKIHHRGDEQTGGQHRERHVRHCRQ